ncbi:MAG: type IV pilus modification protein PilV [Azoarcus sp.]|jgi:type IV pilus assembly protein PilV|nr:type IV pilus modification protein PilV [Azoarcus sp.]
MRIFKISGSFGACAGSSLIEVLVSVFILAFGLFGVAGLQITSLRSAESALERSQAVFLSYTILDAIRANTDKDGNIKASDYSTSAAADIANLCDTKAISASDAVAKADLEFWIENLQENLGQGACGGVHCDGNKLCTVTITWDDSRGDAGGAGSGGSRSFITRSRL